MLTRREFIKTLGVAVAAVLDSNLIVATLFFCLAK
ncbi:MAG: twin-arginine translocation signal domain-containing protein [Planctomycetota bacterium]